MASDPPTASAVNDSPRYDDRHSQSLPQVRPSSPLEMRDLNSVSESSDVAAASSSSPHAPTTNEPVQSGPATSIQQNKAVEKVSESRSRTSESRPQPPVDLTRSETEAIGPSSDNPVVKLDASGGPAVLITLLLTTGARHPYKIDEKYLKKRNVNVDAMDPFNISVYTLKELIWRDWREEWEPRPTTPSYIRLIHFGRMLDDKHPLKDCRFQQESPNVVHMTIKPQEILDEDDGKTGKGGSGRDREGSERTPGCRCVIL